MDEIGKRRRVSDEERKQLAKQLVDGYIGGTSVRALSEQVGWSYGFVHRVLREAGVVMRPRGKKSA